LAREGYFPAVCRNCGTARLFPAEGEWTQAKVFRLYPFRPTPPACDLKGPHNRRILDRLKQLNRWATARELATDLNLSYFTAAGALDRLLELGVAECSLPIAERRPGRQALWRAR
jgi:hypothetical protein